MPHVKTMISLRDLACRRSTSTSSQLATVVITFNIFSTAMLAYGMFHVLPSTMFGTDCVDVQSIPYERNCRVKFSVSSPASSTASTTITISLVGIRKIHTDNIGE